MKVLLTGGTGLIGSAISERLILEREQVWTTSRYKQISTDQVTWLQTDINRPESAIQEIKKIGKVDALIHNAATIRPGPTTMDEYAEVINTNIGFTYELFKWAEKNVSQSIVYLSSLSFLQRPIEGVVTEDALVNTQNVYAFSKLAGEQLLATVPTQARKISFRVSSPVTFLSEQMPETVIMKMIRGAQQEGLIKVFGNGTRRQDFVASSDIASAVSASMKSPNANGVYNIASGSTLSMSELAILIAKRFDAKVEYCGTDPLDKEVWDISIDKARKDFSYSPEHTSRQGVSRLLSTL